LGARAREDTKEVKKATIPVLYAGAQSELNIWEYGALLVYLLGHWVNLKLMTAGGSLNI
jgi:hypothetical protein